MKKMYKNYMILQKAGILFLILFGAAKGLQAQVHDYTFSQSTGTFNSIAASGDLAYDGTSPSINDSLWVNVAIPFTFKFSGVDYTSAFVNFNGGVTFGEPDYGTSLISRSTPYNGGAIAVMNKDLWRVFYTTGDLTAGSNVITNVASFKGIEIGKKLNTTTGIYGGQKVTAFDEAAGTITMSSPTSINLTGARIEYYTGKVFTSTEGTAPNRVFVIEWIGYNDYFAPFPGNNYLNFQLRLAETSNTVSIVYGPYYQLSTEARTSQVGLRGAESNDFNNRYGDDWNNTSAGTTNTAAVFRDNVIFPESGLTFTWTPPVPVLSTVETAGTKGGVRTYPNPFTDILNISNVHEIRSVSVTDAAGRLVKTIDAPSSTLHLEELKPGLYVVVLNMKDGSKQSIKAIKK
ncbi:T9SS type A sorting domain-containing protein [Chryseobacterium sp. Tr-659]|uniref:T9SS type A sorting domain-containing protein n=1 Tax=Chryseobacterium sp. Tr-659 TaxID=2608340 RepID=UPI00141F98D8|nr:T9SS type A sorting domain-containing protein [Chryseobacterium sp. Tr-659]NIF05690.1 T9SS type A sorting domain-containing protein [Chryseobacterium sp. Tr-659]